MTDRAIVWHEVECGAYAADLPLWEELADAAGGPILDLGCGTGRVALHLARRGHEVVGLDTDPALVAELNAHAHETGLPARAIAADATGFSLDSHFALAIAPMQLVQLLAGKPERQAMLAGVAAHLERGAILAAALLDGEGLPESSTISRDNGEAPLPDVREVDGWVFSSLPLAVRGDGERLVVKRLREAVSPAGELSEEVDITELHPLSCAELEAEAREAGLRPAGRLRIAATDSHVGSTVCLLEAT
jgi:SAM-dependent methyltransferase